MENWVVWTKVVPVARSGNLIRDVAPPNAAKRHRESPRLSRMAAVEQAIHPMPEATVIRVARSVKLEDTYHSTTIEGYRITKDEVRAVLEGPIFIRQSRHLPPGTEKVGRYMV